MALRIVNMVNCIGLTCLSMAFVVTNHLDLASGAILGAIICIALDIAE